MGVGNLYEVKINEKKYKVVAYDKDDAEDIAITKFIFDTEQKNDMSTRMSFRKTHKIRVDKLSS